MELKYCFYLLYCIFCSCILSCSANNTGVANGTDTLILNTHTIYINTITELEYNKIAKSKKIQYDSTSIIKRKNELILNLADGKKLVLKDSLSNSDQVDQVTYKYVGFLKDIEFYIVIAQHYETGEYLLVNYKTGSKTKVWGLPKLSPDKKHLSAASSAIGYEIMPNGIQMWAIPKNGELKLEWEYSQNQWGPDNVEWVNDNTIYVIKKTPDFLSSTKKEERDYIKLLLK